MRPVHTIPLSGEITEISVDRTIEQLQRLPPADRVFVDITSNGGCNKQAERLSQALQKRGVETLGRFLGGAGVTVFLAGKKRFVTSKTSILLSNRNGDEDAENRSFAHTVSKKTHVLSTDEVLRLMDSNATIDAENALRYQFADGIIDY